MKKQSILITLLSIACLVGCGAQGGNGGNTSRGGGNSNSESSGGNSNSSSSGAQDQPYTVYINDFGTERYEAEDFDTGNWISADAFDGEVVIEDSEASGGYYLAGADNDDSVCAEFKLNFAKKSIFTFKAAFAQTEATMSRAVDVSQQYRFTITNLQRLEHEDKSLPARTSSVDFFEMSYVPFVMYAGEYDVKLEVLDTATACPNLDYIEVVTSDPNVEPATPSDIIVVPENHFLNLEQYRYAMDPDPMTYGTYSAASDSKDLSSPNSLKLRFDDIENASTYYVQVAKGENDFSGAKTYTTSAKFYELWNAELGETYYYKAATSEAGLASAEAKNLKVSDLAPRVIKVSDVLNFRDIGGWDSSLIDGKIKQGLYYRCAQLNAGTSHQSSSVITDAGKKTIQELGIKVDIDMRDSRDVPTESPAKTAEWDVEVVNASVASGTEDYRFNANDRSNAIKPKYQLIFQKLAQCDTNPALLHCTYGADRTGIVTFFLEALLGMSQNDMIKDYAWTNFTAGRSTNPNGEFKNWVNGTNAYTVDSSVPENQQFAEKMKKHLMDTIGVPEATLEHIREIFLPGYVAKA